MFNNYHATLYNLNIRDLGLGMSEAYYNKQMENISFRWIILEPFYVKQTLIFGFIKFCVIAIVSY